MCLKIYVKELLISVLCLVIILSGCRTAKDDRVDRIKKATKYFDLIKQRPVPSEKIFTLPECIETALQNNLDFRVLELAEKINDERNSAALLAMLPDIYATFDFTSRSNEPGAKSISLADGSESLVYSKSTKRNIGVFKLEMAFSLVDFGLSYFKALQSEDRGKIAFQQRRRAAQNLVFDVAKAYYRVAAAQYAMKNTEKLMKLSKVVETNLENIAKSREISPLRILAEKKQILKLKQELEEYKRVYENSCIELKTLMGYAPWNEVHVDTSVLASFNPLTTPNIDLLEQIALRERPELFQLDTRTRITVNEARKALVLMFPNVRIFLDFTKSTNPYLYHASWWEMGIRAAYHLLRLPQQIQEYKALNLEVDEMEARTYALTAGVMAQVRIAHANLFEVEGRYKLTDQIYNTHVKQLKAAKEELKAGGDISQLELFKMAMATAKSSIDRSKQLGNYYLAFYRLLNATGVESFNNLEKILENDKQLMLEDAGIETTEEVEEEAEALDEAAEESEETKPAEEESNTNNE